MSSTLPPDVRPVAALSERLRAEARRLGFALVGVTEVRGSEHAAFYRAWLERGMHGSMAYLAREDAVERRTRPDAMWPELRSAIVLGMPYAGADADTEADACTCTGACACAVGQGIIARYALSRDYHRVLKARVMDLLRWLEAETDTRLSAARAYVDTGPVLERELAQRAGLGWFGRNTMLINPGLGSYFFLAALLVEVELEPDAPFTADRCGTCTRCVDACPTGALLGRDATGAPVMDATRCISYLTIEQKGAIPVELRSLIGDRIYGCDICQEVCPWNRRRQARDEVEAEATAGHAHGHAPRHGGGEALPAVRAREVSLVEMMRMTRDEWDLYTRGSAMRRAGYEGLKRNVAVALGNALARGDRPDGAIEALRASLSDGELIAEHAGWALQQAGLQAAIGRHAEASSADGEPGHSAIAEG